MVLTTDVLLSLQMKLASKHFISAIYFKMPNISWVEMEINSKQTHSYIMTAIGDLDKTLQKMSSFSFGHVKVSQHMKTYRNCEKWRKELSPQNTFYFSQMFTYWL